MHKIGEFLRELNDPKSKYGKKISTIKKGTDLTQRIGRKYNKYAQWLGWPIIPDIFIK